MLGESDDSGEIRRDFHRTLVRTDLLEIEVRTADGRTFSAKSRDVSLSGVYIASDQSFEQNSLVRLVIGSLSGSAALQISAEIVYSDPGAGFGARFLSPAEEAHGFLTALIARLRDPSFGADPPQTMAALLEKHRR